MWPNRKSKPLSTQLRATCHQIFRSLRWYSKSNPADAPILTLALTSNILLSRQWRTWRSPRISQRFRKSPVWAWSQSAEARSPLCAFSQPCRIVGLCIGLEDLRSVLATTSINTPKGTFDGDTRIIKSIPMISCCQAKIIAIWWSPIRMERP